jgi:hypothetical protein
MFDKSIKESSSKLNKWIVNSFVMIWESLRNHIHIHYWQQHQQHRFFSGAVSLSGVSPGLIMSLLIVILDMESLCNTSAISRNISSKPVLSLQETRYTPDIWRLCCIRTPCPRWLWEGTWSDPGTHRREKPHQRRSGVADVVVNSVCVYDSSNFLISLQMN